MNNYTLDFNNCKIKDDILSTVADGIGTGSNVSDWGDVWLCLTGDSTAKHIRLQGLEKMVDTLADQMDIMLQIFAYYNSKANDAIVEVAIGDAAFPINGYFKA